MVWQHPLGTSIMTLEDTLLNAPTPPGVDTIVELPIGSPLIAIAKDTGPTVPPVEIATLVPNMTLNRALH